MATKKLTIEGITFPKFKSSSSKRNFRLTFFIEYTDAAGETQAVMVTKPQEGQWKWGNSPSDFPLFPEGNDLGDSVELNLMPLRAGQDKFKKGDAKIADIDGDIVSIAVNFVDVKDKSVMDILKKDVLPQFVAALEKSGFNPINFIPGMGIADGIIRGTINKNFNFKDVVNKGIEFLGKRDKDKILYSALKPYDGSKLFAITGRKEWESGKTGTYEVKIGVK